MGAPRARFTSRASAPSRRADIEFAGKLGYTIKLLGVVKVGQPAPAKARKPIQVSVYPALIPNSHVLASVNHVFNAVFVRGDVVGDTLFYGRGAGKDATASAVLSDIADAALDLKHGTRASHSALCAARPPGEVLPIDEVVSRYYLRLNVIDKPGTLARISARSWPRRTLAFPRSSSRKATKAQSVPLILMSHEAPNAAMKKALAKIARSPVVKAPPVMLRVESFDQ